MNAWRRIAEGAAADYTAFLSAFAKPRDTQFAQLRTILAVNRNSEFGKHYGFNDMRDVNEFRARVPVHSYADLAQDIARMTRGARDVLCGMPVHAYEETGGSSGGAKLIPYTDESLAAFRRALLPWFADLIRSRPGICDGRAYWALSPVVRARRKTPDGTPIGLSSEAEYLGPVLAPHFSALSVVPPELACVTNMDTWRYLALRYLLDAEDLTLISVWSPTFLFPLLETLMEQRDRLTEDVAVGKVCGMPEELAFPAPGLAPKPERARTIARALCGAIPDTHKLWPRLDTISCWTDAGSRRFCARLREQ
ncbi:MAG: GH3 auxin-responsive promoter family protein, partial [Betaproteobacteria bacterium]|nr:GH3 auxin-responsive promoter family protein [Betaproteobacteria bacterium]